MYEMSTNLSGRSCTKGPSRRETVASAWLPLENPTTTSTSRAVDLLFGIVHVLATSTVVDLATSREYGVVDTSIVHVLGLARVVK